jgi:hypothetical protein
MVPHQHQGQHPLVLEHNQACQNGEHKGLSIQHRRAHDYWATLHMPTDNRRFLTLRVNCVASVPVRRGSFGLQDPSRKGGSDEGVKTRKKSWCVVEYGGVFFFEQCQCHVEWEVLNLLGFCTGWKVRDTRVSFPKGLLLCETPNKTCIQG